jgi:hypothetical protein
VFLLVRKTNNCNVNAPENKLSTKRLTKQVPTRIFYSKFYQIPIDLIIVVSSEVRGDNTGFKMPDANLFISGNSFRPTVKTDKDAKYLQDNIQYRYYIFSIKS